MKVFAVLVLFTACCLLRQTEAADPKCDCAMFGSGLPVVVDNKVKPVATMQANFTGNCDEEGVEKCIQGCKDIGVSAYKDTPSLVCKRYPNSDKPIHAGMYIKLCNEPKWKYSGISSTQAVCCEKSKPVACRSN